MGEADIGLPFRYHPNVDRNSDGQSNQRWVWATVTALALLTVLAAYMTALRVAVEMSPASHPNDEDSLYFGLHGAALAVALVSGGLVGYWYRRQTFAIGVLFVAVTLVWMIAAQYVSFELACSGHNDIIRHWQC